MKRWIWYVLAAVMFALAGGGVIYGVLTHKEPGLMTVCWENGVANYSGDCKELRWLKKQMPLRVYLDLPDASVYQASIINAADVWNQHISPVFNFVDDPFQSDIIVTWGARESGDSAGGFTKHWGGPEYAERAEIQLQEPSDLHTVMRYAAHEFGHVLGLNHDEHGVMKPKLESMTENLKFTQPTDHDRKLLRRLYK